MAFCSACNIANGANADCKGCLINATSFATVKACLGKRYMPVVAKQCVPPNRLGATSPYIACPGSCQVVPCATYSKVDGTCIDGSCCGPTTSTCSGVKFCGLCPGSSSSKPYTNTICSAPFPPPSPLPPLHHHPLTVLQMGATALDLYAALPTQIKAFPSQCARMISRAPNNVSNSNTIQPSCSFTFIFKSYFLFLQVL